jgi:DNA invertase Pin-like site-specific DNA recombinase
VYTNEGISAKSIKHMDGFQQMVEDALAGRIDLIVTKSVSRFAQNTVDSLTTIRKLKEHCTEVYFEKESIWSFDSKGEVLFTIMSSLVKRESRSIYENVRWGQWKKISNGRVRWNDLTIKRVLSNEPYMDDKLLQKTYSNDFLDKPRLKNEWQVSQVYVEGCHDSGGTIFSTKIYCGDCGQMYGPNV